MSIALKMQKALIGPGAAGQGLRSDPGISQGREHLEFIGDLIISQFQLAAVVDAQHICAVFGRHTVLVLYSPAARNITEKGGIPSGCP